ncbi:MAG: hypothetical protein ACR2P8_00835 [Myxococcota bacterium]
MEDVARELAFCSANCRDLDATTPAALGRAPVDLVSGLDRPIRTGWLLWLRQVPRLTSWVALPLGIAVGVLRILLVDGSAADGSGRPVVYDVSLALAIALGAAGSAVVLSRAYTGAPNESPWGHVASRLLPWSVTWLIIGSAVLVGSLLLLIPGIIAGIRLFWADEFALMHGRSPRSAVRESLELSRGLTGRVFGFQIILGFAEYLVLVPLLIGVAGLGVLEDAMPDGPVETLLVTTLMSVMLVNTYASLHAPEVVYFYGLRALRSGLAAEDLQGDWVARGLRQASQAPEPASAPRPS